MNHKQILPFYESMYFDIYIDFQEHKITKRRKDTGSYIFSGKGSKTFPRQIGLHYSTVGQIIQWLKNKNKQTKIRMSNNPIVIECQTHHKVSLYDAQKNCKKSITKIYL